MLTIKSATMARTIGLCLAAVAGPAMAGQYFQGLGMLPGATMSKATAVSSDGSTIVGYCKISNKERPFRWTRIGGMEELPMLAGASNAVAWAVSGDGSVVVGECYSGGRTHAIRWVNGVPQDLGALPGQADARAYGVSLYGNIVVGASYDAQMKPKAFRWVSGQGMEYIGSLDPNPDKYNSQARSVSFDGSVVSGQSVSTTGNEAFVWRSGSSMVAVGDLPGGLFLSKSCGLSGDGKMVVGCGEGAGGSRAFWWTQGTGIQVVPAPSGDPKSEALALSEDGTWKGGFVMDGSRKRAFFRYGASSQLLKDYLMGLGDEDAMGWDMNEVSGISAMGETMAANGSSNGVQQAFAVYTKRPDPCSLAMTFTSGPNTFLSYYRLSVQGGKPVLAGWRPMVPLAAGYEVKGFGNFSYGGGDDILLYQPATRRVIAWITAGTLPIAWRPIQVLPDGWSIQGVGDFDADGDSDILIKRDADGFIGYWALDGSVLASWRPLDTVPSGWEVKGCPDFNGDGMADVMLQWTSGAGSDQRFGAWLFDGYSRVGWIHVTHVKAPWQLVGFGDLDNDGDQDALMFNTADRWYGGWLMNNGQVDQWAGIQVLPANYGLLGTCNLR